MYNLFSEQPMAILDKPMGRVFSVLQLPYVSPESCFAD